VERHGIAWQERKHRQFFCEHSSKEILRLLETECNDARVTANLQVKISGVQRAEGDAGTGRGWVVSTSQGEFTADAVVIACGSQFFPKLGTTPLGLLN